MSNSSEPKCPVCHVTIEPGQTLCGNCKAQIVWKDGQPSISAAQVLQRTGCALTSLVWIVIPSLLVLGLLFSTCFGK